MDVSTEQTIDQQLEELFKEPGTEPVPGKGKQAQPKPGKEQPAGAAASPQPLAVSADGKEATDEDPLEKALKEIEETEPEKKPEVPALSSEQQSILAAIPSAEVATNLYKTVENYNNFTGAFEGRKFEDVESMFNSWDKDAFDDFLEYIYTKRVASGEWVDRFIADQEGRGTEHKETKKLQKDIADLRNRLESKDRGNADAQKQAEVQRVFDSYKNYVGGLFDKIGQAQGDRKYIIADLNERLSSEPKVLEAVRAGNLTAVHSLFKTVVREYNNREKIIAEAKDAKLAEQGKHKPPVSGGVGAQSGEELPEDVRQVPKGQEDNWMGQQLGKLFKKAGLGKK